MYTAEIVVPISCAFAVWGLLECRTTRNTSEKHNNSGHNLDRCHGSAVRVVASYAGGFTSVAAVGGAVGAAGGAVGGAEDPERCALSRREHPKRRQMTSDTVKMADNTIHLVHRRKKV